MGFGTGLGFVIARWRAESQKPCRICLGLEGDHAEAPARPHPNCECDIELVTEADGAEPQLIREYTTTERTALDFEFLGSVEEHEGLEVAKGYQFGFNFGAEVGHVGGGFVASTSNDHNRTFSWDPEEDGDRQDIYDVYATYVTTRTSEYRRANGDEVSIDEVVSEDHVFLKTIRVESGDTPFYGEGGAGEAEDGGDDDDDDDDGGEADDGGDYGDGMSMSEGWDE